MLRVLDAVSNLTEIVLGFYLALIASGIVVAAGLAFFAWRFAYFAVVWPVVFADVVLLDVLPEEGLVELLAAGVGVFVFVKVFPWVLQRC